MVPQDNDSIDSLGSLITDIFSQPIDIEVSSWIKEKEMTRAVYKPFI